MARKRPAVFKWILFAFLGWGLFVVASEFNRDGLPRERKPGFGEVKPRKLNPGRGLHPGRGLLEKWVDKKNNCVVEFEDHGEMGGDPHLLSLSFSRPFPTPATIDRLVILYLRKAAEIDDTKTILAMAFDGHTQDADVLEPDAQYAGPMVWSQKTRKITPVGLED